MTSNQEAQADELLALSSIYDQSVFFVSQDNNLRSGHFTAHLKLPQPFHVIPPIKTAANHEENHLIQHLPPIMLHFQLPADYPSISHPEYAVSSIWLKEEQLSKLRNHLDMLWKDNKNEVILFQWIQFLLEEALQFLNITSPMNLQEITHAAKISQEILSTNDFETNSLRLLQLPSAEKTNSLGSNLLTRDCLNSANLYSQIIEYDKCMQKQTFESTIFSCKVCFRERLGSLCINFNSCNHVFCKDCMQSYFEVLIKDGNVRQLNCPEEKCTSQALPCQIRELVSQELFDKYDQLLLSSTLDSMSDVMYCPRISCQCPVMIEPNSTMGCCPNCCFVFCIFCMYAYHGVAPCHFKTGDKRKLYQEYSTADDVKKSLLERRYGKRNLQLLAEDLFTEEWLESNSKKCPHCKATIEKIDGCNKMSCWKCNTFFCWLCMCTLSKLNPYGHYSDPGSNCYNQLFHGINEPEADDEDWIYLD